MWTVMALVAATTTDTVSLPVVLWSGAALAVAIVIGGLILQARMRAERSARLARKAADTTPTTADSGPGS